METVPTYSRIDNPTFKGELYLALAGKFCTLQGDSQADLTCELNLDKQLMAKKKLAPTPERLLAVDEVGREMTLEAHELIQLKKLIFKDIN